MIRNKNSTYKSDVWAFGVILYQMITGDWPFKGGSEYLIFKSIMEDEPEFNSALFPREI